MNKSRNLFLTSGYLLISVLSVWAQSQPDLKGQRVVPGNITRDGKRIEGYILMMGTGSIPFSVNEKKYSTPWSFQKEIRFITKDQFEALPKIKFKDYEKLEPGDIDGYSYNNDSLTFDSRKYANLNTAGLGMIPKMTFLRRLVKNKISIYAHFNQPSGNGPEDKQVVEYTECSNPTLLFQQGEDNAKMISLMSIEKQITDCPKVIERYKNGEYNSITDLAKEEYGDILTKASNQDIAKLFAIAEFNRGICN
jgi:hypothetical protein